jgi:two-component system alkaline phosphatase synthesis response regulator PhoP
MENIKKLYQDITVIVIDDDQEITDFLTTLLKTDIHQIVISYDGRSGLEKTRKYVPDLILLNVNLPDINGIEICRILKSDELTKNIPIIMITGRTDLKTKEECYKAGADDFITKPFEITELVNKVNNLLQNKLAQKSFKEQYERIQPQ